MPSLVVSVRIAVAASVLSTTVAAQGIRSHEIGMDTSEIVARRITGAIFAGATRGIINGVKSTRGRNTGQSSRNRSSKPHPIALSMNRLVAHLNQLSPSATDAAASVVSDQTVNRDAIEAIDARRVGQSALTGLLTPGFEAGKVYDQLAVSSLPAEASPIRCTEMLREMVVAASATDWRTGSFRGVGRGRAVGQLRLNRSGVAATASVDFVSTRSGWKIVDLRMPSENVSLVQWTQYRLIEAMPESPLLQSAMEPGRQLQSAAIESALRLDPYDVEFQNQYAAMDDATRQWPLVQYKVVLFNRIHQPASWDDAVRQQLASVGVSAESIHWINRVGVPSRATKTRVARGRQNRR